MREHREVFIDEVRRSMRPALERLPGRAGPIRQEAV
jgi:hypothetical protein